MPNRFYLTLSFIFFLSSVVTVSSRAQINERVFKTDYRIDPDKKKELLIEFDNLDFFKNNEYESDFLKGYTLPGFWAQLKLAYQPLENIKVEAGVHLLRFWGANKYPNFAYQDISTWKGNQFQKGFHALPYLRAQVKLSERISFVFGDIYGGANHNLIEPLYNPELNLMADPEAGLQVLYNSKPIDIDIWINWESFIFNLDTHQEAFTAGLSSRIKYNKENSPLHLYTPFQVLAQHRGGEIDTITTSSVQTLMNGAIGIGVLWNINNKILKNVNVELDATGYYQQAGDLWPFDDGYGFYARASADLSDFRVKTSYWRCKDFISMLGNPFYGAVSTSKDNFTFKDPQMVTFGIEYSRSFGKVCSFGIDLDIYQHLSTNTRTHEENIKKASSTSFSIGAYLRLNTSFLIKRF